MPAIDGIKVYGESNASCDKLKLNYAVAREKIGERADSGRGLAGYSLKQLFGVAALCRVHEENSAARFILRVPCTVYIEHSAVDVFAGGDLFQSCAERW